MVKLLHNKDYNRQSTRSLQSQPIRKKPKSKGFFLGVTTTSAQDRDDESEDDNTHENGHKIDDNTSDDDIPNNTTVIDINASDTLGRTCIHYLVQPFPDGSYTNNIKLLKFLHRLGASLTKPDLSGLSPFDYSAINGCQHLCDTLTKLTNEEQKTSTKVMIKRFHINDPNKEILGLPDYYSDAQAFIDQYISDHPSETVHAAYQVDPLSNMSQTGEIVIDTEKNEPYDVRLTITDVDYGLIGLYNFYRMQIIKHKSKTNLYLLLTRWGRIGDGDGQHQLTPFSSFEECRKEFCKIFREKTGNSWENTDQFENKPKKYTLIQLNERKMQKYTDVPIDFELLQDNDQHPSSKLQSSSYKNLFKTFFNPQAIRSYLGKIQLDIEWMPVSQLKPESLQKARDILVELKKNIEEKEKLKLTIQQSIFLENKSETEQSIDPIQRNQLKLLLDSICKLTNEYYTIIPLQGYGYERLPIIDSEQAVKAQEQKLYDIFQLELSVKILLATQANLNQISPLDYLYKSINCQFEAMDQNDIDFQLILRYIWTSAPRIQIEQIFKIARPNDDERLFQRNLDNHYLLWHGTNICNLISILTRGMNFS
jgi:predicted DNA-binding WGR domain protein